MSAGRCIPGFNKHEATKGKMHLPKDSATVPPIKCQYPQSNRFISTDSPILNAARVTSRRKRVRPLHDFGTRKLTIGAIKIIFLLLTRTTNVRD